MFKEKGVAVYVKRDDLIHPVISGNKWRKLKLNIEQFKVGGYEHLLTFGGAYSNHIAATARAGKELGISTIGIIRGDELDASTNDTLRQAAEDGMQLVFTAREEYALRSEKYYQEELRRRHGHLWIVPEGGANFLGMMGCVEITREIEVDHSHLITACGTGTTASGLLYGSQETEIIGVSALKNGSFLKDEIKQLLMLGGLLQSEVTDAMNRFQLLDEFHFGGYAKQTKELINFMNEFFQEYKLPLDYVYSAKMFYALHQLIQSDYFKPGSCIVALHTGGLQGNQSISKQLLF